VWISAKIRISSVFECAAAGLRHSRAPDATGLAAGAHEYKVIPRNSRGDGPESAVSVVNVT